jgi:hypothetical protein
MNNKIKSEIAFGIILIVAIFFGGLIWLELFQLGETQDDNFQLSNSVLHLKKQPNMNGTSTLEVGAILKDNPSHGNGCDMMKNFENEKWFSELGKLYQANYPEDYEMGVEGGSFYVDYSEFDRKQACLFDNYFVFIPWESIAGASFFVFDIEKNELKKSPEGKKVDGEEDVYFPMNFISINNDYAIFEGGTSSGDNSLDQFGNYYYKTNLVKIYKECNVSLEKSKTCYDVNKIYQVDVIHIEPDSVMCKEYSGLLSKYGEINSQVVSTAEYIKNSEGLFCYIIAEKLNFTPDISDIVKNITFSIRDKGWQKTEDNWDNFGDSLTEFGDVYKKNKDLLVLNYGFKKDLKEVEKCNKKIDLKNKSQPDCIDKITTSEFLSIMIGKSKDMPIDPNKISTNGTSYTDWKMPAEIIERNENYFKDTYSNDCIKLENGDTSGGDLLSTLIIDQEARKMMKLHVYSVEYVKKLEKQIAQFTQKKYKSNFYAFSVCHLKDNLDVVAGILWPTGWSTNDSEFGDRDAIVIINDYAPVIYEEIQTTDKTATGAEVTPCDASESNDSGSVLWTCFEGLYLSSNGYVSGSRMTEWKLPINGGAPIKRDYIDYD